MSPLLARQAHFCFLWDYLPTINAKIQKFKKWEAIVMSFKEEFAEAQRRFGLLGFYDKFEYVVILLLTALMPSSSSSPSGTSHSRFFLASLLAHLTRPITWCSR